MLTKQHRRMIGAWLAFWIIFGIVGYYAAGH